MTLGEFNALAPDEATAMLLMCCDVPAWAAALRDGRPYETVGHVLAAADRAAGLLTPDEVAHALAAHPRIGEGPSRNGREAAWSRQEQSCVAPDSETRAALAAVNHAYERRHNRVFLICATGLSAEQILAAARRRLGNDDAVEAAVVVDELRKIARMRLKRVLEA
ncbi:2-oxo-4-hydroxy-4-carboxy-5-ureidoimidazoline decarboxylase [Actinomadura madurae]|uniref:2-oxo-4-hydroxy-4-carboxy-5-ureidoimidazoline decarboxylase n=1 Tax=Actinomadura madurae TaxID=1993 RepID=UPI00399BFB5B